MTLEVLKGLTQIKDCRIKVLNNEIVDTNEYITIDYDKNIISFKMQKGSIEEAGRNGCQAGRLIDVAYYMIAELNKKHPCDKNMTCLNYLFLASRILEKEEKD